MRVVVTCTSCGARYMKRKALSYWCRRCYVVFGERWWISHREAKTMPPDMEPFYTMARFFGP